MEIYFYYETGYPDEIDYEVLEVPEDTTPGELDHMVEEALYEHCNTYGRNLEKAFGNWEYY